MASQLADALNFIRHHQDGEIAEKMRNAGLQYNMIYGVSSMLLANYAKEHGRNQELADLLWKENFREAKLMALMFAEYQTLSNEKINQYIDGCENNEMVEIGVIQLFSLVENALQYAKQWITAENRYKKMAGYLLIARLVRNTKFSIDDLHDIIPSYEKDVISSDYFVFQSVSKAVQELFFRCPNLKLILIEKTKYICEENKNTQFALQVNDVLQSINY